MKETLDIGYIPCACGCGMEAQQIMNGVPVPNSNPHIHYKNYRTKLSLKQRQLGHSEIEHFTEQQINQLREWGQT